ncbi:MAG: TldD/PmbA family protein [candidate division WOR-3 bacterium]
MKAFLKEVLAGLAVDYADIRIEESETTRIVYRGRELEDIGTGFERGGCLRVFYRGNWVIASFNTVDDSLKELADELAIQAAELPPRDGGLIFLPALDEIIRLPRHEDPRTVPLAQKQQLIHDYNQLLLTPKQIISTVASYLDSHRTVYWYSSEDRYIEQEFVRTGFSCQAIARDGANIQQYGESFGRAAGFESLRGKEGMVERVARIAIDLLKAEPVSAGTYTVIIDPLLGGIFAHEAFGHLSEADHIAENERLKQLMRIGTRYGVEELTIVDDPTLPGENGSYRYDDEGVPAQRTDLIKNGVIASHLHSRHTAYLMGEGATGNARAISYRFAPIVRMSNTYIVPQNRRFDEMLAEVKDGLYVVGSRGGMTELETFTFSSQYAYRIENGRLTKMVRDATLAGNVFETLRNIDAIGNDLMIHGGLGGCGKDGQSPLPVTTGAPHIRIRNVVIGGR